MASATTGNPRRSGTRRICIDAGKSGFAGRFSLGFPVRTVILIKRLCALSNGVQDMKRLLIFAILAAFFAIPAARAQQTQLEIDEKTLKDLSLPTDAKGLVDFFEKRSLKDGDAKH